MKKSPLALASFVLPASDPVDAAVPSAPAAHAGLAESTDANTYHPFAYLSAPNAALYRRITKALLAEKERFTVHVRPDQVSDALAARGQSIEESVVADALERLAQPAWGMWWPTPTPAA